ncbi:MAG: LUD domain-containing protein [Bacteroidales bacterium]|nr:LUD domain-containing protein [Bacteroidales bacterium]
MIANFKDALYLHYLNTSAGAYYYYKSRSAYEIVKQRAAFYRYKVLHDERKYLVEFEKNFSLSGGKALYAETADDAQTEIKKILEKVGVPTAGASDSKNILLNRSEMIDEIGVENFLAKQDFSFIAANIYKHNYPFIPENYSAFIEKIMATLGTAVSADESFLSARPEDIYRQYLRQNSYKKSVVISAVDFLVADTGGIVVRNNSGCSVLPLLLGQTKIFVAGIDMILASLADLSLYSRLYAAIAYNRPLSFNQTIFSGRSDVYLILVDNGRTEILSNPEKSRILSCIHCGACEGICPTGNPVEFVRSGCADCCTLCGHCQDVFPVNIPLKELILKSRKEKASLGNSLGNVGTNGTPCGASTGVLDKSRIKTLTKMFLKRKNIEKGFDRFLLKRALKKAFGSDRVFPRFDRKTFNQIWMKEHPVDDD